MELGEYPGLAELWLERGGDLRLASGRQDWRFFGLLPRRNMAVATT
jgi:hypothetical protein